MHVDARCVLLPTLSAALDASMGALIASDFRQSKDVELSSQAVPLSSVSMVLH